MSEIWTVYEKWRNDWDNGSSATYEKYKQEIENTKTYQELKQIVGRGLNDHDLSTTDLKVLILQGRQVKTLKGW